ncbi:MAG: PepSY domain-containing protein [Polymorphobacter sp.]
MIAVAAPVTAPATAGVENQVREMVLAGEIMPYETIRNRVQSQVRGEMIGSDFDAGTLTYRFRFLVDGNVINVDVDARTGQRRRPGRY